MNANAIDSAPDELGIHKVYFTLPAFVGWVLYLDSYYYSKYKIIESCNFYENKNGTQISSTFQFLNEMTGILPDDIGSRYANAVKQCGRKYVPVFKCKQVTLQKCVHGMPYSDGYGGIMPGEEAIRIYINLEIEKSLMAHHLTAQQKGSIAKWSVNHNCKEIIRLYDEGYYDAAASQCTRIVNFNCGFMCGIGSPARYLTVQDNESRSRIIETQENAIL